MDAQAIRSCGADGWVVVGPQVSFAGWGWWGVGHCGGWWVVVVVVVVVVLRGARNAFHDGIGDEPH